MTPEALSCREHARSHPCILKAPCDSTQLEKKLVRRGRLWRSTGHHTNQVMILQWHGKLEQIILTSLPDFFDQTFTVLSRPPLYRKSPSPSARMQCTGPLWPLYTRCGRLLLYTTSSTESSEGSSDSSGRSGFFDVQGRTGNTDGSLCRRSAIVPYIGSVQGSIRRIRAIADRGSRSSR